MSLIESINELYKNYQHSRLREKIQTHLLKNICWQFFKIDMQYKEAILKKKLFIKKVCLLGVCLEVSQKTAL